MNLKKLIPLLMAGSLCLTSCNQIYSETTNDSSTESTILPVQTTETTRDPNATTYPPTTIPPIGTVSPVEYEDTFESFMQVGNHDIFTNKSATIIPEERWSAAPQFAFFRVVGLENEYQGDFMVYHVRFIDAYGWEDYDTDIIYNKIYRMAWRGHLEDQLYGRPPLEIGEIYGRVMLVNNEFMVNKTLLQAGLIYKVVEEDGKRYIYGYGVDLSEMECAMPITDLVENSQYEEGKHDKAIAYLKSIGKPLPTFDYKCEAEEFYKECYRRIWENK